MARGGEGFEGCELYERQERRNLRGAGMAKVT